MELREEETIDSGNYFFVHLRCLLLVTIVKAISVFLHGSEKIFLYPRLLGPRIIIQNLYHISPISLLDQTIYEVLAMAEAVVSIALETFRDLLLEEGKLISGVGGEVKALQTQLKEMKCLLQDADRRRHENRTVANWIAEIRDVAYRAEDVIESYAAHVSLKRGSLVRKVWYALKEVPSLHQLGSEISQINSELARLTKNLHDYGIKSIIDRSGEISGDRDNNQNWTRKSFPHFEIQDCFVGKEEDLKRLISLVADDKEHRVISVWGMGGIGKTTIAKKVYNHMIETKSGCFESFAWVCITQQCRIRSVLEEVFKQLISQQGLELRSHSDSELVVRLCEVQRAKRCLIVIDDLWEISHWNGFKHAFLVRDLKSKILVTTRKQEVAEIGFSVELGLLKAEDAWELLKHKAFPHGNIPDFASQQKLHRTGKEMVHKCGNLPLAISLLGGVLSKKTPMEWESINENINAYLYRGEGHDGKENLIEGVLNLSYEDLPYYLKPCFLHLGVLREDEKIDCFFLYWMWIAQGMISNKNNEGKEETLMDIAQIYLSELASRGMVQVEVVGDVLLPAKRYDTCKLHDVVRELCLIIGKREDFGVQVLEYQGGNFRTFWHEALSSGIKTRHLVIHILEKLELKEDEHTEFTDENRCKHLRTLHMYNDTDKRYFEFPAQNVIDFRKFKMLRDVFIFGFQFRRRKLSKSITNLVHLRRLCLRSCGLDELPSSISNLTYLDTLDLYGSVNVRVPNVLKKMLRLRHLFLPLYDKETIGNYRLRLDEGIEELETLMGLDSSVHELRSITRMKNLRLFSAIIRDNESLSAIINAIATNWDKLMHCDVNIFKDCELTSEEGLKKLNQLFTFPSLSILSIEVELGSRLAECKSVIMSSKLVELILLGCEIEEDPMEIIGMFPSLRHLYLYPRSFVGEQMVCPPLSFPSLKKLAFIGLPKWREWRVEEGSMSLLSHILIDDCPALEKVPNGLSPISTLQELMIIGMPELGKRVLASRDDGGGEGEDFHIVSHIPSIIIN